MVLVYKTCKFILNHYTNWYSSLKDIDETDDLDEARKNLIFVIDGVICDSDRETKLEDINLWSSQT